MALSIGKGIRMARASIGLRQGVLAERVGITQNYLSLLEHDCQRPSIVILERIAKECGVTVTFLLQEAT